MAKLTPEVLERGRELIRQKDLEGFMAWVNLETRGAITVKYVEDTYRTIFKADDVQKGLFLFEKVFPSMDPEADRLKSYLKLGCFLFMLVGSIGGIVALVKVFL